MIRELFKSKKIILLDGAVGTLLQKFHAEEYSEDTWMNRSVLKQSEHLTKIHLDYIKSGADIITTMTFRTNIQACKDEVLQQQLIKNAFDCAEEARKHNPNVLIAGSNTSAEDCYQVERTISKKDLWANHVDHILKLKGRSDFILNETLGHSDEINITSAICEAENIPYILSIFCQSDLRLLSGESLNDFLPQYLKRYKPLLVSFNCIRPEIMEDIAKNVELPENWGCYINCGEVLCDKYNMEFNVTPEDLVATMKRIGCQPKMIGSCCLSTPDHTRLLKEYIDKI